MIKDKMDKLKILDRTFAHSKLGYCSDYQTSDIFQWDRTPFNPNNDVVFTDMTLNQALYSKAKRKIAWLIEPIDIAPQNYKFIRNHHQHFDLILTHEKSLLDINDKFQFVPFGCCWIKSEDQRIYDKSKNVSIIASNKKMTDGHELRHKTINRFRNQIDVYGRGWNPVDYKLEALKDYRFTIVIENTKRDYWFTEKLIDAFASGCVPIYWGCPSIGDFFNEQGIITFDNLEELDEILNNLTEERYNEMLSYVEKNLEIAKKYLLPDEWVYNKVKE